MSNEPTNQNPVTTTAKKVDEIIRSAGAVAAFLLALFGFADTPIPKTLSLITILVTSIFIVQWRWARLSSKKRAPKKSTKEKSKPFFTNLVEPIRSESDKGFLFTITRRRFEFTGVVLISIASLGWAIYNIPAVINEFKPKSPFLACSEDGKKDQAKFFIIVASPKTTEDSTELLIAEKIYDSLVLDPAASLYEVCRLEETFQVSTQAVEAAAAYQADVVIWGRSDVVYEIHLEVPALTEAHRNASEVALEEAASFEFQNLEPKHISFITKFTLSELLVLNGQFDEARGQLERALVEARQNSLNPVDLAKGRYLLGLYYDPYFSPDPDIERSVEEYTKALENDEDLFNARVNRSFLYTDLGRTDEAIRDLTFLIENADDEYKGMAYINRSFLQTDPEDAMRDLNAAVEAEPSEGYFFRGLAYLERENYPKAIADFKQAILFDPEYYENYEYLGLAQLHAGKYGDAEKTFTEIIPYLVEEDREQVIADLDDFAADHPEAKTVIEKIKSQLKNAQLKETTP